MAGDDSFEIIIHHGLYEDLDRISRFYAAKDAVLARRVEMLISEHVGGLNDFPGPYRFPAVPLDAFAHFREAYIPFGRDGFIVRFEIDDAEKRIVVYRVHHSRENRMSDFT